MGDSGEEGPREGRACDNPLPLSGDAPGTPTGHTHRRTNSRTITRAHTLTHEHRRATGCIHTCPHADACGHTHTTSHTIAHVAHLSAHTLTLEHTQTRARTLGPTHTGQGESQAAFPGTSEATPLPPGGGLRWDAEAPPWEDRAKVINKSTRSKYIRVAASRGLPARNPQEVVSVKNDARHHSGSKRGARRGRARLVSQRPRVPSVCLRCRKGTRALATRPPFRSGRRGAPLSATWRGRGRGAGSGGPR